MSLIVKSPAKLNLFLHITGRRSDGYHELQTLFQFIDFYDQITFTSTQSPEITVTPQIPGVLTEQNLIYRAAHLLQQTTHCPLGAHIELEKHLPMGGGLGGGSSNAASTLIALNTLWNTHLTPLQLSELGLTLGADVPIFIHGKSALATGVGERFETVDIPEPWYLIAIPNCHANTAELFQEKQLTRNSKVIRIRDFLEGAGRNDFEPILRKRFPLIDRCLQLMSTEKEAKVTGSGACLFSSFDNKQQATQAKNNLLSKMSAYQLTNQQVSWKIAKGCNCSLLFSGMLARQG